MVPRAVVLLTLLLSACQSTDSLSTVEVRQQEHQLVVNEPSIQEVASIPNCAKKELMTKFWQKRLTKCLFSKGFPRMGLFLRFTLDQMGVDSH